MRFKLVPASELSTRSPRASDYVDPEPCTHRIKFDKLKSKGAVGSMAPDADGMAVYLIQLVGKCQDCGAKAQVIVELDPSRIGWGETPRRKR